jgi:hypothetical protein
MRKPTLPVAGLIAAGVVAIPAFAATTTSTVTGTITPSKSGTVKAPAGVKLFTQVATTNDDGTQPPPVRTTVLTYGKEIDFNGRDFPICSKAVLDAQGPTACPKGSQVGAGSSDALLGAAPIKNIKVTAFNGGANSSNSAGKIELYVGAPLQKTIEGVEKGAAGKLKTLTFSVPKEAINPVGNTYSSITRFGATITAKGKKASKTVNYAQTTGCPKGGIALTAKFIFATKSEFPTMPDNLVSSAPSTNATFKIKCTAGK